MNTGNEQPSRAQQVCAGFCTLIIFTGLVTSMAAAGAEIMCDAGHAGYDPALAAGVSFINTLLMLAVMPVLGKIARRVYPVQMENIQRLLPSSNLNSFLISSLVQGPLSPEEKCSALSAASVMLASLTVVSIGLFFAALGLEKLIVGESLNAGKQLIAGLVGSAVFLGAALTLVVCCGICSYFCPKPAEHEPLTDAGGTVYGAAP